MGGYHCLPAGGALPDVALFLSEGVRLRSASPAPSVSLYDCGGSACAVGGAAGTTRLWQLAAAARTGAATLGVTVAPAKTTLRTGSLWASHRGSAGAPLVGGGHYVLSLPVGLLEDGNGNAMVAAHLAFSVCSVRLDTPATPYVYLTVPAPLARGAGGRPRSFGVEVGEGAVVDERGNPSPPHRAGDFFFSHDNVLPTLVPHLCNPAAMGSGATAQESVILAFSEAVQAGSGTLKLRRAGGGAGFEIDVANVTAASTAHASLIAGNRVVITPSDACTSPTASAADCADLTWGATYYLQIEEPGAFLDLAGNPLQPVSTMNSWSFTVQAQGASLKRPKIGFVAGAALDGASIVGSLQFTERVWPEPGRSLLVYDCGRTDPACASAALVAAVPAEDMTYGDGGAGGHYGLVAFSANVGGNGDRRYKVVVPVNMVKDNPSASELVDKNHGPPDAYSFHVDVGDFTAPTLDAARTHPGHGAGSVGAGENIVLAFSEVVQAGAGSFEVRRVSDDAALFAVDVQGLRTPSGPGRVLFQGDRVQIAPRTQCVGGGACPDLVAGDAYYLATSAGVLANAAGHALPALSTAATLSFSVVATGADTRKPEALYAAGQEVSGATLTSYVYFTERLASVANLALSFLDCGLDGDCGTTHDNLDVTSQSAVAAAVASASEENGLLRVTARPPTANRRYRVVLPASLVLDAVGNAGPTAPFGFEVVFGVAAAGPPIFGMTGYLGTSCSVDSYDGRLVAVPGVRTYAEPFVVKFTERGDVEPPLYPVPVPPYHEASPLPSGDWLTWTLSVDASHLVPGEAYRLCSDLDGAGLAQTFGYSGLRVQVAGVTSAPAAFHAGAVALLRLHCAAGCSTTSRGYLAHATMGCDAAVKVDVPRWGGILMNPPWIAEPANLIPVSAGIWDLPQDTTNFTRGTHYRLCMDLDGGGTTKLGLPGGGTTLGVHDAGFAIYTTFVTPTRPGGLMAATSPRETLHVRCEVGAGCTEETTMHLAVASCDAPAVTIPGPLSVDPGEEITGAFTVPLDTSLLSFGHSYQLCMDLDGAGPGGVVPTGLEVYITPVVTASPSVRPQAGQVVGLTCATDSVPPVLDAFASRPANGTVAAEADNIVLAFSETVQLGSGYVEFWAVSSSQVAVQVDTLDIAAAGAGGHSLLDGSKLSIPPPLLCRNASGSCLHPSTTYFVRMGDGVLGDASGNAIKAFTSEGHLMFSAVGSALDVVDLRGPEIAFVDGAAVAAGVMTVYVHFTEGAERSTTHYPRVLDCGPDLDCERRCDNPEAVDLQQLPADAAAAAASGVMGYRGALPAASGARRYLVTIPAALVRDAAQNDGPSLSYSFYVGAASQPGPDTTPPSLDVSCGTTPAHGVHASRQASVILAFSEVVQAGEGFFELWDTANDVFPAFAVDVQRVKGLSNVDATGFSLMVDRFVYMTPKSTCSSYLGEAASAVCEDLGYSTLEDSQPWTSSTYYLRTSEDGVVRDAAGNALPRLDTRDYWSFTVTSGAGAGAGRRLDQGEDQEDRRLSGGLQPPVSLPMTSILAFGASGSNECPPGSYEIADAARCALAATEGGWSWSGTSYEDARDPSGCGWDSQSAQARLNLLNQSEVNANISGTASLKICEKGLRAVSLGGFPGQVNGYDTGAVNGLYVERRAPAFEVGGRETYWRQSGENFLFYSNTSSFVGWLVADAGTFANCSAGAGGCVERASSTAGAEILSAGGGAETSFPKVYTGDVSHAVVGAGVFGVSYQALDGVSADTTVPEVVFVAGLSESGGVLTGFLYFSEHLAGAGGGGGDVTAEDCGPDIDCEAPADNTAPVAATEVRVSLASRGALQHYGALRFRVPLATIHRRYRLRLPAGYVQDGAGMRGPLVEKVFHFDYGNPGKAPFCSSHASAYLATACDGAERRGSLDRPWPISAADAADKAGRRILRGGGYAPAAGTAAAQMAPTGGLSFTLGLDATALVAGSHYRLCVDLDGAAEQLAFGQGGPMLYASPATELVTKGLPARTGQVVRFMCPLGCNTNTQARLALDCDEAGESFIGWCVEDFGGKCGADLSVANAEMAAGDAVSEDPRHARTLTRSDLYEFTADTSVLTQGMHYQVCVDLDGFGLTTRPGDTCLAVYVTPVLRISTMQLNPLSGQVLVLECPACSKATEGLLSADCDDASAPRVPGGTIIPLLTNWTLQFDASQGTPGAAYRLCLDADGTGAMRLGDAGFELYLRPATALRTPGARRERSAQVAVDCPSCTTATTAYLTALPCDVSVASGTIHRANATQTLSAAMAFSGTGAVWTVALDTTGLEPGRTYRFCTDVDGAATALAFGDTGFRVLVHDVATVTPMLGQEVTLDTVRRTLDSADSRPYYVVPRAESADLAVRCLRDKCYGTEMVYLNQDMDCNVDGPAAGVRSPHNMMTSVLMPNTTYQDFTVRLDTSGLTEGRHYWLCLGIGDYRGSTGHRFYASAVVASPPAVRLEPLHKVALTCSSFRRRRTDSRPWTWITGTETPGPRLQATVPLLSSTDLPASTSAVSLEFDKPITMGDGGFYVGVDDYTGEAQPPELAPPQFLSEHPRQALVLTFRSAVQAGSGAFQVVSNTTGQAHGAPIPPTAATFAQNKVVLRPSSPLADGECFYVSAPPGAVRTAAGTAAANALDTRAAGVYFDVDEGAANATQLEVVWSSLDDYHCLPGGPSGGRLVDVELLANEDVEAIHFAKEIKLYECVQECLNGSAAAFVPGAGVSDVTLPSAQMAWDNSSGAMVDVSPAGQNRLLWTLLSAEATQSALRPHTLRVTLDAAQGRMVLDLGGLPADVLGSAARPLRPGGLYFLTLPEGLFSGFGGRPSRARALPLAICRVERAPPYPRELALSSDRLFLQTPKTATPWLGAKRYSLVAPYGAVRDGEGRPSVAVSEHRFSHDILPPALDAMASRPPHKHADASAQVGLPPGRFAPASPQEAVVLTFSEVVQAGAGLFELWGRETGTNGTGSLQLAVDVADVAAAGREERDLIVGRHVYITPRTLCTAAPACGDLADGMEYYLRTSAPGVLRDVIGNRLPVLDTLETWRFSTAAAALDDKRPEVAFVGGHDANGTAGVVFFTERVVAGTGASGAMTISDCGSHDHADAGVVTIDFHGFYRPDPACASPVLVASSDPAAAAETLELTYGDGSGVEEYGALRFAWTGAVAGHRYVVRIPPEFVRDSSVRPLQVVGQADGAPTANSGPSREHVFYVDLQQQQPEAARAAGPSHPFGGEFACEERSQAYLATACADGRTFGGVAPGTLGRSTAAAGFDGLYDRYDAWVDTSGLAPGLTYRVCTDLDGPEGPLGWGDSGLLVYGSPVRTAKPDLVAPAGRSTRMTLVCGAGCSTRTELHLAEDCIFGKPATDVVSLRPEDASLGEAASTGVSVFTTELRTDGLVPGHTYRLCADHDGLLGRDYSPGDTGISVHASGVLEISPAVVDPSPEQHFRVVCDAAAGCSFRTTAYLSRMGCALNHDVAISSETLDRRTRWAGLEAFGDSVFGLTLDTRALVPGYHYRLCVDLDGDSWPRPHGFGLHFGASAVVYFRGVTAIDTVSLSTARSTTLRLTCAACSAASKVSVAASCGDEVDVGLWLAPVPGARAAAASLRGSAPHFDFEVDATGLRLGAHYRLCVDLDGDGGAQALGDSGIGLFASPALECASCAVRARAGEPLELRGSVAPLPEPLRTENETHEERYLLREAGRPARVYLSARSSCDAGPWTEPLDATPINEPCGDADVTEGDSNATRTEGAGHYCIRKTTVAPREASPAAPLVRKDAELGVLRAAIDAAGLPLGATLLVCVDVDGEEGSLAFGDTGLRAYTNPVSSVDPVALPYGPFTLTLGCEDSTDGCLWKSRVWLSAGGCGSPAGAGVAVVPKRQDFEKLLPVGLRMDSSSFTVGQQLRLCQDWGNLGRVGDVGVPLFVTPVTGVSPMAVDVAASQRLEVLCPGGCPMGMTLHLAEKCGGALFTPIARLEPLAAGGERRAVVLDTSGLRIGASLALCADVDGFGAAFSVGDTRLRIYVRGWRRASTFVNAAAGQRVELACTAGCSFAAGASRAYVASDCAAAGREDYPVKYADSRWTLDIDASWMVVGRSYRLCATLASSGETIRKPYADTNLPIFVSPFSRVATPSLVKAGHVKTWLE